VRHSCEKHIEERISTKQKPYHFVGSGLRNVYLVGVKYHVCKLCKKQAAELPGVIRLFDIIQHSVVRKDAPLSGAEIRFLRKQLGKSSKEFARLVGVSPEHLSRWENGHNMPSKAADRYIRTLVERGEIEAGERRDRIVIEV